MKTNSYISRVAIRTSALLLMVLVISTASATLGDSKLIRTENPGKTFASKSFKTGISLHPNINFRGAQVINVNQPERFININTVVTYQKGNNTFQLPIRKKVILNGKLTFNPNAATR